jgi:hypothetical protein
LQVVGVVGLAVHGVAVVVQVAIKPLGPNTVAALPVTVGQTYPVIVGGGGAGGNGTPLLVLMVLIRSLLLYIYAGGGGGAQYWAQQMVYRVVLAAVLVAQCTNWRCWKYTI